MSDIRGPRNPYIRIFIVLTGMFLACCTCGVLGMRAAEQWSGTPAQVLKPMYRIEHPDEIADSAERHHINPYIIAAVAHVESAWDAGATSRSGAQGLMQLMPDTAGDMARWKKVDTDKYPLEKLDEPAVSIEYGTAYLRYLMDRYQDLDPVLAAYNAGLSNADRWLEAHEDVRTSVDFPETDRYIHRVNEVRARYEQLYPDAFPGWGATPAEDSREQ